MATQPLGDTQSAALAVLRRSLGLGVGRVDSSAQLGPSLWKASKISECSNRANLKGEKGQVHRNNWNKTFQLLSLFSVLHYERERK